MDHEYYYVRKTINMMKNTRTTPNILIMSDIIMLGSTLTIKMMLQEYKNDSKYLDH